MSENYLPVIAAAAALTYATRIAGLAISDRAIPAMLLRFLRYVPIAAFAALVAPGIAGTNVDVPPRIAAAAAASLVVLRFNRLWLCITTGLATYWLTRLLL